MSLIRNMPQSHILRKEDSIFLFHQLRKNCIAVRYNSFIFVCIMAVFRNNSNFDNCRFFCNFTLVNIKIQSVSLIVKTPPFNF